MIGSPIATTVPKVNSRTITAAASPIDLAAVRRRAWRASGRRSRRTPTCMPGRPSPGRRRVDDARGLVLGQVARAVLRGSARCSRSSRPWTAGLRRRVDSGLVTALDDRVLLERRRPSRRSPPCTSTSVSLCPWARRGRPGCSRWPASGKRFVEQVGRVLAAGPGSVRLSSVSSPELPASTARATNTASHSTSTMRLWRTQIRPR